MKSKIRVLLVDDSALMRTILASKLTDSRDIEVVDTASNGESGLRKIKQHRPDLVVLDVEMPGLGGLETLVRIREDDPSLPVIMFSGASDRGARLTTKALSLGAADFISKPSSVRDGASGANGLEELARLIRLLGRRERSRTAPEATPPETVPATVRAPDAAVPSGHARATSRGPSSLGPPNLLAIGSSTGGPNAVTEILSALPRHFPVPVLITQHMPPVFTKHFADRLNRESGLHIREGFDGAALRPGTGFVAPGGRHMLLQSGPDGLAIRTTEGPPEHSCRPAVDPMLRSISQAPGIRPLIVILTGMGADGALGCVRIREEGGHVIAQDEASSVVWGMPGAVARAGAAHQVLPLGAIAGAILKAIPSDIEGGCSSRHRSAG